MYNITGIYLFILYFFYQVRKSLILHLLYPLANFIISLDIGGPDIKKKTIGKQFSSSHLDPLKDPTLDPALPPAMKPIPYQELLKKAEENCKPIKPIKHQKSISKNLKCPNCGAPYLYIYNGGKKYSPGAKKHLESNLCKICGKQWFPSHQRTYPPFKCPFCGRPLYFVKTRKEFDLYRCKHKDCPFWIENKVYYKHRSWFLDVHKLELASPAKPKVNLSNCRFPPTIIGLAITMCINFGLCFRNCSLFLNQFLGIYVNHTTIYNWVAAFAHLLFPLVSKFPVFTATKLVIDETYERCKGKWHYFYACMNLDDHHILAPHFSERRNAKAVATTLMGALNRLVLIPDKIEVVHDCSPTYFLAIQLINQTTDFKIVSCPIKGLRGGNYIHRCYKNIIERFFGDAKVPYHVKRGFGSLNGAIIYNILFCLHYNYFQHHNFKNYPKPLNIRLDTTNPIARWNKLIDMVASPNNPLMSTQSKQQTLDLFSQ